MAQGEKEMNADGHLNRLMETRSVEGYVVFNSDGIPMRYDNILINHKKAVHISSLFSDYFRVCRKIMNEDLKCFGNQNGLTGYHKNHPDRGHEHDVEMIRMRTSNQREYILTYHNEFFMVCIQKFIDDAPNSAESDVDSQKANDEYGLSMI